MRESVSFKNKGFICAFLHLLKGSSSFCLKDSLQMAADGHGDSGEVAVNQHTVLC